MLFGATGFAGQLAAEYAMRAHGASGLRIALGGRSLEKLEAVQKEVAAASTFTPKIVVADADDDEDMARLAASTSVVATTAGPFAKFGSKLFGACAAAGTDCADITGEAQWIALMAHEHDAAAVASGATLVPGAGLDLGGKRGLPLSPSNSESLGDDFFQKKHPSFETLKRDDHLGPTYQL